MVVKLFMWYFIINNSYSLIISSRYSHHFHWKNSSISGNYSASNTKKKELVRIRFALKESLQIYSGSHPSCLQDSNLQLGWWRYIPDVLIKSYQMSFNFLTVDRKGCLLLSKVDNIKIYLENSDQSIPGGVLLSSKRDSL